MHRSLRQRYCVLPGPAGEEDNRDNIARFSREHASVCFPASALGCASEQLCVWTCSVYVGWMYGNRQCLRGNAKDNTVAAGVCIRDFLC